MASKTKTELEAGLEHIRRSPKDQGRVDLIVRRPGPGEREVLPAGELDLRVGLVGDSWSLRGSAPNLEAQVTLMNIRVIALLDPDPARWPLAGDQIYLDLDLGVDNLPPGSRLSIGTAVLEVSALPHTGCASFSQRFGPDAMRFVNSPEGKQLRLRGVNAKVVQPGTLRLGDSVQKA